MKRNDQFRVLAVIRPPAERQLDGGSSTVDRRLLEMAHDAASCRSRKKRKGGPK